MGAWVTCMSYAASNKVGDFGTLYAADAAAAIVKINPCIVDGPNVWKESSQIQWKLNGTARDPKLSTPLAFRWGKGGSLNFSLTFLCHSSKCALPVCKRSSFARWNYNITIT